MPIDHRHFQKEITKKVSLNYQLFLPDEYDAASDKKWPFILFLHGIHRRGSDIQLLDGYGLTAMAESTKGFEFLVAAPQCPSFSNWPMQRDAVIALVYEVATLHKVDAERIYLTGFSMGGNGAWDLAAHYPDLFAAVVPLAGYYDPELAHLLKDMPVWTFHGDQDDIVSPKNTEAMVDALQQSGGNVTYTSLPDRKHPIMEDAYGNPALYQWLLSHKK
ncbi:esterase [compost metagenome]